MTSFENYSNGSSKATPLVPHSQTINKICKPSYASLYANATTSTNPNPPPPVAPKPQKHKKPMKMTLDLDSAVDLDSAIKALEHKKKMLEAKMVQAAGSGNQNNIPPPTAQKSQFYENVMHQGGGGNQDKLIYSNIIHGSATGGPQNLHHELSIDPNTNEEDEFEFPPPPSPVSSSYSELRRATDGTNHRIPNNTGNIAAQQHHQPQNHHMQTYSNDYGIYGNNSTTYESIYEPINPRPPSQMSSYSLYAPYGDTSGYSNTPRSNRNQESEVDALTDLLVESMQQSSLGTDNYGVCVKCNGRIMDENSGCTAMEQIYHIACFTCQHCQINLQGKPFYVLDGMPYCENDYMDTLEKCSVCLSPILERILRATGKPYHPRCFCCVVCGKSLDGIPFTVDATNQIHCIEDFHKKFAPRCCVCQEPIMPEPGQEETVRVVALDRSFHISCYKCEDCGLILSSEAEGRGCYPLDDHVLCKSCNATRVQALTSYM